MSDEPTNDPFSNEISIEGEPSKDELRRTILSRDIISMPTGISERRDLDEAAMTETQRSRLYEAKILRGPGAQANEFERAVHQQHATVFQNNAQMKKLIAQHDEVRSFDSMTGEPVYQFSDERRKAMRIEVSNLTRTNELIASPAGQIKLEAALEKAVAQEQRIWRLRHVEAAAQRLATKMSLDDAIRARAESIRKTKPSGGLSNSQN